MNARVLVVTRVLVDTRFRELSMKASARDALTIVHVAWLSDAISRLKRTDFQAVMAVDSGECRSLFSLAQHRWPWRLRSPPPRALS
jgi:hypothetical protein